MTLRETKIQTEERVDAIERRLAESFDREMVGGWNCFIRSDGSLFVLDAMFHRGALVIGYAENAQEALINRFEDGDLFYVEDMDEEAMFQAMLEEING